jgi:glycosyltransferase involved in cell wall biosynthesis
LLALTVGRLHEQKGIDVLLQSAALWPSDAPPICFLIIGDGDDRDDLERRATELKLGDRVRFVGWRDDVPYVLPCADLFVLPTRWEGLPFVLLEAMAAGVPVVSTRVSGVPEAVGNCGRLVEPEDPRALCDAVLGLAGQPEKRAELSAAALQRVRTQFELADLLGRTCDLWEPVRRHGPVPARS